MSKVVPVGMVGIDSAANHLHVSKRVLRNVISQTPLEKMPSVSLGQSLGSYRLMPQLGIALVRQWLASDTFYTNAWLAALEEVLASAIWRQTVKQLVDCSREQTIKGHGSAALIYMQLSETLLPSLTALQETTMSTLQRYSLAPFLQMEDFVVDRIEDEDFAVILVGDLCRPYLFPRSQLRIAGLEHEKAVGVLMATRTTDGIFLDVWQNVGHHAESENEGESEFDETEFDTGMDRWTALGDDSLLKDENEDESGANGDVTSSEAGPEKRLRRK